uniref:Uncharacterized protein n=1 Tax=Quercus lobata TaxID=97700 RepID=A0A7N2LHT4_QUELO
MFLMLEGPSVEISTWFYEIVTSSCPPHRYGDLERDSHLFAVHFPALTASVVRLTGAVCSWVSLVSVAIDIGISSKNLMLDFRLMGYYLTAFESCGARLYAASSALFPDSAASSALFPDSAASSVLLPALFPVLLFSIDVLVFAGNTLSGLLFSSHRWCFCSHHSSFHHCPFLAFLSVISEASHHDLRVALDHGILELTLSLLLLLCRISSSSSRFICVYTPS